MNRKKWYHGVERLSGGALRLVVVQGKTNFLAWLRGDTVNRWEHKGSGRT